jgi:glycopeptide antibiotics resistance protein
MLSHRSRTTIVVIGVVYLGIALAIGFWPSPVDRPVDAQLSSLLALLHSLGLPRQIDYNAVEFSANIVFFIPAGAVAAALLARHRWWMAVLLGACFSGTIELGQLLLLPARFASWNDILANTLGAALGAAAVSLVRWRRATPPASSAEPQ